jgi:hypothetical protein
MWKWGQATNLDKTEPSHVLPSKPQRAFDRIIQSLADGGADEHLEAGDGLAVLGVPGVAFPRSEAQG